MSKKPVPTLDKRKIGRETIRIFWQATIRHKRLAILSLLGIAANVMMSILVPFYAGKILASLAHHDPRVNFYLGWLAGITLVAIVMNRYGMTKYMVFQARAMSDLHEQVFTRLLQRGSGFHTNQIGGKLVSDALDFVTAYSVMSNTAYLNGLTFLLVIISGLAIVFSHSLLLGLYILIVVAITLVWVYVDSRMRASMRSKRLIATKNLTAHLSDTIVNAQTVKTFAAEDAENKRNLKLNHTLRDLRVNDWQKASKSANSRIAALLIMQVILLFLVSRLSSDIDVLAIGIFAFSYVLTITNRLFELNALTRQFEESFLQASPMTQMLLEDVEITDLPNAPKLQVSKGAISFNDVRFNYNDAKKDMAVFSDLNLTIKPGEKVGLVGPSGGGKSTLTRLLLRFENINAGSITVDKQNIAEVTQMSLRHTISYVPQEPLLFHRSIKENIAYGRLEATNEEIIEAAKKARAHKFIELLPQGYDTIVGERGVKLSGGQRQRIAIARALLKDAPILVLDEATSALDSESEVLIQEALWKLMQGRTAIVIAHRLSTIQKMDRIIVLDDGKIVEEGSHKVLLGKKGLYAKLWAHQSGGFIEE